MRNKSSQTVWGAGADVVTREVAASLDAHAQRRQAPHYAKWLIAFMGEDLTLASDKRLQALTQELWVFMQPSGGLDAAYEAQPTPSVRFVRRLQTVAKGGLNRLNQGRRFGLREGVRYGIMTYGKGVVRTASTGSVGDLFRAAVIDVLERHWPRFARCPRCRRTFFKDGKRKFCSPKCRNSTNWGAFKAKRQRDYHQEYSARVRKRVGPNVVTTPRKKR